MVLHLLVFSKGRNANYDVSTHSDEIISSKKYLLHEGPKQNAVCGCCKTPLSGLSH